MSQEQRPSQAPLEVFCVAALEDTPLLQELEIHLSPLIRQGVLSLWHEGLIAPGTNRAEAIETHREQASVILLLVSAPFLASQDALSMEQPRVWEQHDANAASMIPIIVRPCAWQHTPLAHLQCLPREETPITSWPDRDDAWTQVVLELRQMLRALPGLSPSTSRTTLPSVWNIPYPRNPFFLGRDDLVEKLRNHLQAGQTTALTQPQAISGLGGIGKTQIALEYAYRYRQEYQVVWWALAESRDTLIASMTELAVSLRLLESEAQEQDRVVTAVKTWLQGHRGWLLILDNADDLALLPAFLPPTDGGHVLLTTRAWDMQRVALRVEVERLSTEVGAAFLLRRAGRLPLDASLEQADPDERVLACQIVEHMGGLPLALDQAGAYLNATGMSLKNYLPVYQQHRRTLHQRRGSHAPDHPEPVATTWHLAVERIHQQDQAAGELLQLCAFLAADAIPEEMLIQGAAQLGPVLAPVVADAFHLGEAIAVLRRYSLIQRHPHSQTLALHRLVQAVIADELDAAARTQWRARVTHLLLANLPAVEFAYWSAWENLLGHILIAFAWREEESPVPGGARLFRLTGWYLSERARYQEAKSLLEQAVEDEQHEHGEEHPDTAYALHALASLYQNQGKYELAEPLYQRALRIKDQALGAEQLETDTTADTL